MKVTTNTVEMLIAFEPRLTVQQQANCSAWRARPTTTSRSRMGSRRMAVMLEVNRKRIQRLMRIPGIEALYPEPNLSLIRR